MPLLQVSTGLPKVRSQPPDPDSPQSAATLVTAVTLYAGQRWVCSKTKSLVPSLGKKKFSCPPAWPPWHQLKISNRLSGKNKFNSARTSRFSLPFLNYKSPVYMERHPSKPTFHIFPYKTVENVAKQTVYMINKKLVRLEGWPVGGSYSINIFACPAGSTRSIRANQSMRQCYFRRSEHARALLARAKGSTPFSHINAL